MKQDPLQKLILGNISKGWKPVRNPKSKYFITEAQYAEENYPDFATGPSYLVSKAAVEPLVETALGQLYIHLEDVFLTGVVAEKLGVERRNNDQFKNNAVRVPARFMGCTLLHTITIHKVTFSQFAQRSKECAITCFRWVPRSRQRCTLWHQGKTFLHSSFLPPRYKHHQSTDLVKSCGKLLRAFNSCSKLLTAVPSCQELFEAADSCSEASSVSSCSQIISAIPSCQQLYQVVASCSKLFPSNR